MRLNLWTPVLLSVYRAAPFCGLQPAPALPVGICPSGTLLQCTLCTTTEYSLRISGGSGLPRSPSASAMPCSGRCQAGGAGRNRGRLGRMEWGSGGCSSITASGTNCCNSLLGCVSGRAALEPGGRTACLHESVTACVSSRPVRSAAVVRDSTKPRVSRRCAWLDDFFHAHRY